MANNRVQLHKIRGYRLGLLAGLAFLLKCSASQLNISIKKSNDFPPPPPKTQNKAIVSSLNALLHSIVEPMAVPV